MELVAGWVIEEEVEKAGRMPGHLLPALGVLGASLLLALLPPAVALLILMGLLS